MRIVAIVCSVLALAACEKAKQDGSGSAAPPARPAIVTAEMAETFELYIAAFEKLAGDIEHAGSDCKAVLAAVRADQPGLMALAPRGEKLTAAMKGRKDPAAAEWFAATFAERMKKAGEKMRPLETSCGSDAELRAAVGEAMEQFPMVRKKRP